MADLIRQFLDRLAETKGDTHAQSALSAEFALLNLPAAQREPLQAGLDAAAILHWFDSGLLAKMLDLSQDEALQLFEILQKLPFMERYGRASRDSFNVHESTRLGWRKQLFREKPERFRILSSKAADCFAGDISPAAQIEWIYHLQSSDPEKGATQLEKLDRRWSGTARPEDHAALASTLKELEDTRLAVGRSRVWVLIVAAWVRDARGETAQLADVAEQILTLARASADQRAEAEGECLLGDVLQAQGQFAKAHAAFQRFFAICQALAARDPENRDARRELAVANGRLGGILEAQENWDEAQPAFEEYLTICKSLAEEEEEPGRKLDLAVAYNRVGAVLESRDRLPEARQAFEQALMISNQFAALDRNHAHWQSGSATAYNRLGAVLLKDGDVEGARSAFKKSLTIIRQVAERNPQNANWQAALALAYSRISEVLQKEHKTDEAQEAIERSLAILEEVSVRDPQNADWSRQLSEVYDQMWSLWETQDEPEREREAGEKDFQVSRKPEKRDEGSATISA
jgi:tetratricopeptide (TPR) repeat protein